MMIPKIELFTTLRAFFISKYKVLGNNFIKKKAYF